MYSYKKICRFFSMISIFQLLSPNFILLSHSELTNPKVFSSKRATVSFSTRELSSIHLEACSPMSGPNRRWRRRLQELRREKHTLIIFLFVLFFSSLWKSQTLRCCWEGCVMWVREWKEEMLTCSPGERGRILEDFEAKLWGFMVLGRRKASSLRAREIYCVFGKIWGKI